MGQGCISHGRHSAPGNRVYSRRGAQGFFSEKDAMQPSFESWKGARGRAKVGRPSWVCDVRWPRYRARNFAPDRRRVKPRDVGGTDTESTLERCLVPASGTRSRSATALCHRLILIQCLRQAPDEPFLNTQPAFTCPPLWARELRPRV